MTQFISYAQNYEDVLLQRVFERKDDGFYVDIGAYHPTIASVTKALYDRGWNGINLEPGDVFEELRAARPRDVNLRMAVLDRTGEATFLQQDREPGASRVLDAEPAADAPLARTVPCDTLENILQKWAPGRYVDLLKIDAEGAELAIVRSTNWRKLRPRILLIEAVLPWSNTLANEEWEPILLAQGYRRVYFDGINCFYVPEEEAYALEAHFKVPVNALDDFISFNPAMMELTAECDRLKAQLKADTREHKAQPNIPRTEEGDRPQAVTPIKRAVKRLLYFCYVMVRPVVRPLAWRLRSFLIGPLIDRFDVKAQQNIDFANITELRRLAQEMEFALVTISSSAALACNVPVSAGISTEVSGIVKEYDNQTVRGKSV